MALLEILWLITAAIVPLGIGAALSMAGLSPPEFGFARWCLIVPAVLLGSTAMLWLVSTERPMWWRLTVGIGVGIVLLAGFPEGLRWISGREKLATLVSGAADQFGPLIETIRNYQTELAAHGQTDKVLQEILGKYDQLQQSESLFDQIRGHPNVEERLAITTHIIEELRAIQGNTKVQSRTAGAGAGALIIKTAPNIIHVTFSVPMRIAPQLTLYNLPQGISSVRIAESSIGFTAVVEPPNIDIPLETFGFAADARL